MKKSISITVILPAVLMLSVMTVYAIEFFANSAEEIVGKDKNLGVEFSVVEDPQDYIVINVVIKGKKRIYVEIDYATNYVSIMSLSEEHRGLERISKEDLSILNMLAQSLGPLKGRVGDAFMSLFSFVSEFPPNEVMNFSSDSSITDQQLNQQRGFESLCDATGTTHVASYDRGNGQNRVIIEQDVEISECYQNDCLGRCGAGCGDGGLRAGVRGDSTIQRFTQDCLNHDICVGNEGLISKQCNNELSAAVRDFFLAPDCADMSGRWTDNFGYEWGFIQEEVRGTHELSGLVDVSSTGPECPIWTVDGAHTVDDILINATNPPPIEAGCCNAFTYTGSLNSCNTASGTWENECGFSGTWSMSRDNGINALSVENVPSVFPTMK